MVRGFMVGQSTLIAFPAEYLIAVLIFPPDRNYFLRLQVH